MGDNSTSAGDWTEIENEAIVAAYFDMFRMQLAGLEFVKLRRIEALQDIVKRTRPSIEFKFRNISAALERLGYPWLTGYRPAHNYQSSLMRVLEENIPRFDELTTNSAHKESLDLAEAASIIYEQPPSVDKRPKLREGSEIKRLVRKFDAAQRDDRNRKLGLKGEEFILRIEQQRLAIENPKLVKNIIWVSQDEGDGAGFDILSFDKEGRERLLEVKTTTGGNQTPFFISRNEISLAHEKPDKFRLIRLFDFSQQARAFELVPPLEDHVRLEAQNFVATFQKRIAQY